VFGSKKLSEMAKKKKFENDKYFKDQVSREDLCNLLTSLSGITSLGGGRSL
jgi:hypothetical protein